jgi:outer membrane biosynthesis protein TonB
VWFYPVGGLQICLISGETYLCLDRNLLPFPLLTAQAILAGLGSLVVIATSASFAQSTNSEAPHRIKVQVKPEHPALAERRNLSGAVCVQVRIARIAEQKRPVWVLGIEAEKAARKTEFEPAPHRISHRTRKLTFPG